MTNSKNQYVCVKKSRIDGNRGVFAKRAIRKGTKIIEYAGRLVTKREGDEIIKMEDMTGKFFLFSLNKKYDLVGNDGGNESRLMNHSCEPNCESVNENGKHIWIYAKRNIRKGEELAFDYKLNADMADPIKYPCNCGSKKCRGVIIDAKEFKRYLKRNREYSEVYKNKMLAIKKKIK